MADTYTPHYSFPIPSFDSEAWHEDIETALVGFDELIFALTGDEDIVIDVWANSTAYGVGDRVVDTVGGGIWQCLVAHTSGASPQTFAQYRAAHPTHWVEFGSTWTARGQWTQNTFYAKLDFVYDTVEHVYAV